MNSLEITFSAASTLAMIGWVLMIVVPKRKITKIAVTSGLITLIIAGIYLVVVLTTLGDDGEGSFSSLEGVIALFQNPKAVLAGWIHYLAFDLFIGAWELVDSQKKGLPHWLVIPCLVMTLLYGPIGLMLYFIARASFLKKLDWTNNFS